MVLKPIILSAINTPKHRTAIATANGVTEMCVIKWIQKNSSRLTEYSNLQLIKGILKVADEVELLIEKQIA